MASARLFLFTFVFLFTVLPLLQSMGQAAPAEIVLRDALVIPPVSRSGRSAVHTDPIEAAIVSGAWKPPREGDTVTLPGGAVRTWTKARAGEDGWFRLPALNGGYACINIPSETDRVMMLEAAGHSMVYVGGEPRAGDVYANGIVGLPVRLRRGENSLLFLAGRGSLRARLVAPRAPAMLDTRDATLPDVVVGEKEAAWAAVVVVNATGEPLRGLRLAAAVEGGGATTTALPVVPPLTVRKVGFRLPGYVAKAAGSLKAGLTLREGRRVLDTVSLSLRIRGKDQTCKRTFISEMDGSVQYYAVVPAIPAQTETLKAKGSKPVAPALVLTLHGASVEAIGQADAYSPKSWCVLVAPTNRRPYGFDWEDWGRKDALEVLAEAQQRLGTDPRRVYLTGHSMGGHGTWSLGATCPDRFAAIGPSAGWISFQSYVGGPRASSPSPMQAMLDRAGAGSDTLTMGRNYAAQGVYVLHGDADDNVPVTEARAMREFLSGFHHDFTYYEQPGAGHWWDASPEPGADCVDWALMFDLFARHRLPTDAETRQVDFTTVNPGASAWFRWAGIEAQTRAMLPSTVRLRCDPGLRLYAGTTDNIRRLTISTAPLRPGEPVSVELDGQKLEKLSWPSDGMLRFAREGDRWAVASALMPAQKGPQRSGPFKEAFGHRMVFIYGTRGDAAENAATEAKARYDAETWWYRGNGAVDVLPDTGFDAGRERDRSIILYGNADTNAAWKALLAESPVQVDRAGVRIGDRTETGSDLACLFLRPRPGSDTACVGVVAGTGAAGMRLTWRLPCFLAGVGLPDCTLFGAEMLTEGIAGIRAAGFFGPDWGVATGEFAWHAPR